MRALLRQKDRVQRKELNKNTRFSDYYRPIANTEPSFVFAAPREQRSDLGVCVNNKRQRRQGTHDEKALL